jgi:hypothetical protein
MLHSKIKNLLGHSLLPSSRTKKEGKKQKQERTWKTKQIIEGLVFTCLEGGASPELGATASMVKGADDAIAMAASPGRPRC